MFHWKTKKTHHLIYESHSEYPGKGSTSITKKNVVMALLHKPGSQVMMRKTEMPKRKDRWALYCQKQESHNYNEQPSRNGSQGSVYVQSCTGWGRSKFTVVSTQEFLLYYYCIIFHADNCRPTFAPTCGVIKMINGIWRLSGKIRWKQTGILRSLY